MAENPFVTIDTEARFLAYGYRKTAGKLRGAFDALQWARDYAPPDVARELQNVRKSEDNCEACRQSLVELVQLVRVHLPETWPKLRIVANPGPWHSIPGFDWDAAEVELRTIEAAAARGAAGVDVAPVNVVPVAVAEPQQVAGDERPKAYLFGWVDILQAVGVRYGEDTRKHVSRLNDVREGPITKPTSGGSPTVEKCKLIAWWNRLDLEHEAAENQRAGRRLDAEAQHAYGRQATVAPGVGGAVKKRRKDRKP